MEFLWFGERGYPVLLFPTSMGRFWQNEDFGLTGALADKVDAGYIQLVCVDSVDTESWYNKNAPPAYRVRRHDDYDRYLRHELVPYIQHRSGRGDLGVCGASFGAYHAANFAGRYPGPRHEGGPLLGALPRRAVPRRLLGRPLLLPLPRGVRRERRRGARPAPPAGGVVRRHRRARLPRRREPALRRPPPGEGNPRPRRVLARGLRARLALLARRDPPIPVAPAGRGRRPAVPVPRGANPANRSQRHDMAPPGKPRGVPPRIKPPR